MVLPMAWKRIKPVVRNKIRELLTQSTRKGILAALRYHLPKEEIAELKVSVRTVARIAAAEKKAGKPHRRPLKKGYATLAEINLQMRKRQRNQGEDQAIEAFLAGKTYKEAIEGTGISISALYRLCRERGIRRKDFKTKTEKGALKQED